VADDAASGYGPDDYFAFVESFETLAAPRGALRGVIDPLLDLRTALKLAKPSALVWLDCVAAEYFMRLPWRNEICRIDEAVDSARRREQVRALDADKLRVVLLPLGTRGENERSVGTELSRVAWHRISLSGAPPGLPSELGADFDMDTGRATRYLQYLGRCSKAEHTSLVNVFSLDFLPTAHFGAHERGDSNNTPPRPRPEPGGGLIHVEPIEYRIFDLPELEVEEQKTVQWTTTKTLLKQ